jgi:hypothetical protein
MGRVPWSHSGAFDLDAATGENAAGPSAVAFAIGADGSAAAPTIAYLDRDGQSSFRRGATGRRRHRRRPAALWTERTAKAQVFSRWSRCLGRAISGSHE